MRPPTLDELRADLERWRGKVEHLRVQASLGRMELRDKVRELGEEIAPVHARAKEQIGKLLESGVEEAGRVARSLQSGWEEVLRSHRDLKDRAAQQERSTGKR